MSDLCDTANEIVDDIRRTINEVQTRISSQQSPAFKSSKKIKSTKSGITTMSTQIEEIPTHFKNLSFARQAQTIDTSNLSNVAFKELSQLDTPHLDDVQNKEHKEEIIRLNERLKQIYQS
ncbi:hypothetical protein M3Y94_01165700 [Aphelenchoides besseyi]|nr:hypothetical protein M3Y94_01165700 [Aphelenchoides besseyi]